MCNGVIIEKRDADDNSESDMDVSEEETEEQNKKQIETNVPIPAMMPRSLAKGRSGSPNIGPKRVAPS